MTSADQTTTNTTAPYLSDESIIRDSWKTLEALKDIGGYKTKKFRAKETIYHEGNTTNTLYVVLNGMVKLLSYLPNGRARIVRLHCASHWFGLERLVNQPYEHTAIAVSDVEIAVIPLNTLKMLENNSPELFNKVLKHGYIHLSHADKWIAEFSTGEIKARVARLIDYLSDIEYGQSSDIIDLLSVQEMAEMLGVTVESVSRILAEFKRNNTLQKTHYKPKETYEIDKQKLQEEAQEQ